MGTSFTIEIRKRAKQFIVAAGFDDKFWADLIDDRWEPQIFEVIDRFLERDNTYVDLGAWIGPTLLYAAQIAKRAIGVEPDPIAFGELKKNVQLNDAEAAKVELVNVCIAPKTGRFSLKSRGRGGDSMSSLLFTNAGTQWSIEGLSFDEFVKVYNLENCSLIKIDIEGSEYQILNTMRSYIRIYRPTICLSLHPGLLGRVGDRSVVGRLVTIFIRLQQTLKLFRTMNLYRNWFDMLGNKINRMKLLATCIRSTLPTVVLTEREWA